MSVTGKMPVLLSPSKSTPTIHENSDHRSLITEYCLLKTGYFLQQRALNDLMDERANAVLRRAAGFEDIVYIVAIGKANGSSGGVHDKLLGEVTGDDFLVLQQELLELEDVGEGIALGRHPRGIDLFPDKMNKLVAAAAQALDALRSLGERAVVLPPTPHDVEAFQSEAWRIDLLMTARAGRILPVLLQQLANR